jgi:prepilin-type N-terminal cleavage/methylation domain-containing protein/prepilin-type processing-associated H-X9-DG protein
MKMAKSKFNSIKVNGQGFTLVELLVVISIIATLLAVLMPALNKAREQAKKVVCTSNIKNIGLGTSFYTSDNDGYYPAIAKGWSFSWYGVLAPYINADPKNLKATKGKGGRNVFVCPSSNHPLRTDYMDYAAAQGRTLTTGYGIIGINYSDGRKPTVSRRITQIKRQGSIVVWVVEGENKSGTDGLVRADAFIWNNVTSREWPLQFGNRHNGKGNNAVFVDCHVEYRKYNEYVARDFYVY